jgi:hypothetical protein
VVYEDLCNDPLKVTQGVFKFLGWDLTSSTARFIEQSTRERRIRLLDWVQAKHPYFGVLKNSSQSAQAWKTELTERQQAQILTIAKAFPGFKDYWPDPAG